MNEARVADEPRKTDGMETLADIVHRMTNRTPEQKLADRERLMKTARRGRPLPEGKTLDDVLRGQWPGDETDQEIRDILARLS